MAQAVTLVGLDVHARQTHAAVLVCACQRDRSEQRREVFSRAGRSCDAVIRSNSPTVIRGAPPGRTSALPRT